MVRINVTSNSRTLKGISADQFSLTSPVEGLAKYIAVSNKISQHRIRITTLDKQTNKKRPLDLSKTYIQNGVPIGTETLELYVKDLGPQISWRTVFVVEYLGPLLIHPLFFTLSSIYGVKDVQHTQTQKFAYYFVLFHFIKRELETIFLHKFSNATMPAFNIFKNSSHYWILSGFNLAYFVYGPDASSDNIAKKYLFYVNDLPSIYNYALTGLFLFAELSNFTTHYILANLRSEDSKKYVIPFGYGFDLLACPNYTFESLAWLSYALLVGNWSAWVFLFVATGQMYLWAVKKQKRYLQTFGDEYKKLRRSTYIPYVI
ncbi:3-oxo-5a-steroid 4 dehydrogenase [Scheffersomyces xylosifermentans]|uniref:3-oxo-5a-steroid 4 dehydrogenase n=1 Tax=Scheffersomyces xylosifermentans TaxID=1304137 RepID=UPI00315D4EBF